MNRPTRIVSYSGVVDLAHPISREIPIWPGDPAVEFDTVATLGRQGYFLRRFTMGEHSGTHVSTPSSFFEDGEGPDLLPAANLVAPAVLIDVSRPSAENANHALTVDEVLIWEAAHGTITDGALVMLFTGWQKYWSNPDRFINLGSDGIMHTPGFGTQSTRLLLDDRRVGGLATDAPGVDPGSDTGLSISRMVLSRPRLVLECVNNLDQLPPTGATVVVGRLPLVGGSGSPAAVLALLP
jgi:kynurenine formamidase